MNDRRQAGFTLLELITVMLIVAILAAIGLPSFRYVTNSNRVASEINGLLGDLQFARVEAVKTGSTVSTCPAVGGACAGAANWNTGWMVFLDANGNGVFDPGDQIVRTQAAFTGSDSLLADKATFQAVTFNRFGYAATGFNTTVTLALHTTPLNAQWTRCLAVTSVGMMTTQKASVGNCT